MLSPLFYRTTVTELFFKMHFSDIEFMAEIMISILMKT